jgi:hypothetical protein
MGLQLTFSRGFFNNATDSFPLGGRPRGTVGQGGSDERGAPLRPGLRALAAWADAPRARRPSRRCRRNPTSAGVMRRTAAPVVLEFIRDRDGLLSRSTRGAGRPGPIGSLRGRRGERSRQGDGMAAPRGCHRLPERDRTSDGMGPGPAPQSARLPAPHERRCLSYRAIRPGAADSENQSP